MMHQPVPASDNPWRHDVAVASAEPDCIAWVHDSRFDEGDLLIQYDPANEDSWLASDEPLDLRDWS